MTLKTICQSALEEIGGWEVPSSFFGNTNLTAKSCLNLVQRAGNSLERRHRWVELIAEHTFNTADGTASYALPSDFRAFANMSWWDRTNFDPMFGPVSPAEWQFLKSSVAGDTGTITKWFRVKGSSSTQFFIHPTPTSTDSTAYDYYSKNWITKQSDSSAIAAWSADLDTAKLDEDLLILDLKWRFLQAKGMPFEVELAEWKVMRDVLLAANGGSRRLSMDTQIIAKFSDNIPETGFGDV